MFSWCLFILGLSNDTVYQYINYKTSNVKLIVKDERVLVTCFKAYSGGNGEEYEEIKQGKRYHNWELKEGSSQQSTGLTAKLFGVAHLTAFVVWRGRNGEWLQRVCQLRRVCLCPSGANREEMKGCS